MLNAGKSNFRLHWNKHWNRHWIINDYYFQFPVCKFLLDPKCAQSPEVTVDFDPIFKDSQLLLHQQRLKQLLATT